MGLAALAAAGAQFAVLGGASALTVPVPTAPVASDVGQWNGQLEEVRRYRRPHYRGHHRYYRHRHFRRRRPGYGYYYGGWWYARPWWMVPAPRPAPNYGGNRHVNWCLSRYRSYNPSTDRYLGFDGRYHRCHSPFRP
jgi:hypothetical protein